MTWLRMASDCVEYADLQHYAGSAAAVFARKPPVMSINPLTRTGRLLSSFLSLEWSLQNSDMTRNNLFLTDIRADLGKLEPLAPPSYAAHVFSFFASEIHVMERYGMSQLEVEWIAGAKAHDFVNQRSGEQHE